MLGSFAEDNMCVFSQPKPDLVKGIRESLLRHLSAVFGNDDVAAHFMLLHLLSKVCNSYKITSLCLSMH